MATIFEYFFSPFIRPKLRFYFGSISRGVPYFLPRRSVKEKSGKYKLVPKKFGYDFCNLGWKTKWSDTDYRFEWSPIFSFVFYKFQFTITLTVPETDHYWESWLFYNLNTNKKDSTAVRVEKTIREHPSTLTTYKDGEKKTVDMYHIILKEKWRPKNTIELRNQKLKKLLC